MYKHSKPLVLSVIIMSGLLSVSCTPGAGQVKETAEKNKNDILPFSIYTGYQPVTAVSADGNYEVQLQYRHGSSLHMSNDEAEDSVSSHIKKGYCAEVNPYKGNYVLYKMKAYDSVLELTWHGTHIVVMDIKTGKELTELRGHCLALKALQFSPDDQILASGGKDGIVYIWDWKHNRKRASFGDRESHAALSNHIEQLRFSPDSKQLAASFLDNSVFVLDTQTAKPIYYLEHYKYSGDMWDTRRADERKNGRIINIHYSGDNTLLVVVRVNSIELHRASDGQYIETIKHDQMRNIMQSAIYADKNHLTVAAAGNVYVWELTQRQLLKTINEKRNITTSLVFSPDYKYFITGGDDATLRVYNPDSYTEAWRIMYEEDSNNSLVTKLYFDSLNRLHLRAHKVQNSDDKGRLIPYRVSTYTGKPDQ